MAEEWYSKMDSNFMEDDRIDLLIEETGAEGWGIYSLLLRTLRRKPMQRCDVRTLKGFARKYMIAEEILYKVIHEYGLFGLEVEGDITFLVSPDLRITMETSEEKVIPRMSVRQRQVITAKRASNGRFTAKQAPHHHAIVVEEGEEAVAVAAAVERNDTAAVAKSNKSNTGKKQKKSAPQQVQYEWEEYITQALAEDEWLSAMATQTKLPLSTQTEELVDMFKIHVKMQGNEEMICSLRTAKRYMANFFRPESPTHKRVKQELDERYWAAKAKENRQLEEQNKEFTYGIR